MRIAWVHPSWRDLVIDHLGEDGDARERFLHSCSINGALLALSIGGGERGERVLPLLRADTDWDALTDRLHALVPELEPAELTALLAALAHMLDELAGGWAFVEAEALATAVLARAGSEWNRSGAPIPLPGLEAWLMLASRLRPPPEAPVLTLTWAEVLPARAPLLLDRPALERFADWLALVDLLMRRAPSRLPELGFPGEANQLCEAFLSEVGSRREDLDPRAVAPVTQALQLMARVNGALAGRALALSRPLLESEPEFEPASGGPLFGPDSPERERERRGALDVERVLRDL
jgi:hypothetical protein